MARRHVMIDVETQGLPHDKAHTLLHKGHLAPTEEKTVTVIARLNVEFEPKKFVEVVQAIQAESQKKQAKTPKKKESQVKDDDHLVDQ